MTRPVWEEPPTKVGQAGKGVVLTLLVLAVLVPMWSVLVTSFSSRQTINETGGMVFIPREFDPSAYLAVVFQSTKFLLDSKRGIVYI